MGVSDARACSGVLVRFLTVTAPEWVNSIILEYEERSKLIDCEIDHYYGYDK